MNSIYFAGLLSLVVDCESLSSLSKEEEWQSQVCIKLQEDFDDVRLTALKLNVRSVDSERLESNVVIGNILAGRLKVDIIDKNLMEKRQYLFSVNASKDVWVTKKKKYQGEVISHDDVVKKKINIAPFVGLRTIVKDDIQGKVLNKTLKRDEIVFADYLEFKKLIVQKQIVDLVLRSGNLQIKTKGQAMEAAANEGDSIKVRVIETGAILTGLVKGKENVYVEI